jgi:hypothetical protein
MISQLRSSREGSGLMHVWLRWEATDFEHRGDDNFLFP